MKKIFLMLLMTVGLLSIVKANNLNITNVSLTGATSTTIQVQYNMFWNGSWRDAENWDATWVFVKYSTNGGTVWSHATLSSTGHVAGTATPTPTLAPSQDLLGAFVYRSSVSTGTFTITQQQLQWNFTANGLNQSQAAAAQIRVYGIEMVYIPLGMFALGDGMNNTGTASPSGSAFRRNFTNRAVYITDQLSDSINDPMASLNFKIDGDNGIDLNNDGVIGSWPTDIPSYPTGYMPFYMMKYEITQGQYVDFLNTLTYTQQNSRVNNSTNTVGQSAWDASTTALPTNRYNIFVQVVGVNSSVPRVYTATRPDRVCQYLSWSDGCAYADWCGFRPMTEMEFEKAVRGPQPPIQGEYAGRVTSYTALTAITSGAENGQEVTNNTSQNYSNPTTAVTGGDAGTGPVRAGIFARSSTTRQQSMASYYGVMDMSGGLTEAIVGFDNLAGRSFTGVHGNGVLMSNGAADVNFWPGINGNTSSTTANATFGGSTGVTGGAGAAWRDENQCVACNCSPTPISTRCSVSSSTLTTRYNSVGFRAVKSNF
jgi:formylglycine-generating enzyme required for sulfatase activity